MTDPDTISADYALRLSELAGRPAPGCAGPEYIRPAFRASEGGAPIHASGPARRRWRTSSSCVGRLVEGKETGYRRSWRFRYGGRKTLRQRVSILGQRFTLYPHPIIKTAVNNPG